jgi:hypothetical protein
MLANNNIPEIEFSAALLLFATNVAAHELALQVNVLNSLLVPHVAVPPPVYPALQVTSTVEPIVPVIELAAALLLFVTCVGVQEGLVHSLDAALQISPVDASHSFVPH